MRSQSSMRSQHRHWAWPIEDVTDLRAAVASFGRAASSAGAAAVKRWITKRARELGAVSMLPDSWGVERGELVPWRHSSAAIAEAELEVGQMRSRRWQDAQLRR